MVVLRCGGRSDAAVPVAVAVVLAAAVVVVEVVVVEVVEAVLAAADPAVDDAGPYGPWALGARPWHMLATPMPKAQCPRPMQR